MAESGGALGPRWSPVTQNYLKGPLWKIETGKHPKVELGEVRFEGFGPLSKQNKEPDGEQRSTAKQTKSPIGQSTARLKRSVLNDAQRERCTGNRMRSRTAGEGQSMQRQAECMHRQPDLLHLQAPRQATLGGSGAVIST